jgi:DNA-binding MarR family transcriptional regulator
MTREKYLDLVNGILVEIFNDILKIEEKAVVSASGAALTINEIHILEAVGPERPLNMSTVAHRLGISLPALTISANRLVGKGYIERERLETDRRKVMIQLTRKGRKAYEHHMAYHKKMVEAIVDEMDMENMPVLVDALKRLRAFFKTRKRAMLGE